MGDTRKALRISLATTKAQAKFILATDGQTLGAEELSSGETITGTFLDFPNHFGFLLPLAVISTMSEIKDNPIDVRATGRLNKRYVELVRENPAWVTDECCSDMNHFMARLVFFFFAEDTDIFNGKELNYSLKRWAAPNRFADAGELPLDNNWIENQIRPIAIGRNRLNSVTRMHRLERPQLSLPAVQWPSSV